MKVMAVASGGGHWVQLMQLKSLFSGADVSYVSTDKSYKCFYKFSSFSVVHDANMNDKFGLFILSLQVLYLVIKIRPSLIITTGAAPGFFSLLFGKLVGARTVWIDSIANSEEMSLSGRKAKKIADLWLTQWPHLQEEGGPKFIGSVI